jgi:uncharacterized membrane protein YphA (DoxX/SURF4 family)
MQRLFSMFPRAAPGMALVLLRLAVVAPVWTDHRLALASVPANWAIAAALLISGAVLVGLLTPIAAGLCAVIELNASVSAPEAAFPVSLSAAATAAALALLGPGAYSIDAALFGRRVFVVASGKPVERE